MKSSSSGTSSRPGRRANDARQSGSRPRVAHTYAPFVTFGVSRHRRVLSEVHRDFSAIAAPLSELTKDRSSSNGASHHEQAFRRLKVAIAKVPC